MIQLATDAPVRAIPFTSTMMGSVDPGHHVQTDHKPLEPLPAAAMRTVMSRFKANSLLMLAAVIWGVGNVFHKTILAHLDPMAVVFLTSVIAALVTLPFAVRERAPLVNTGWFPSVTRVVLLFALGCVVQQLSYVSTTVTDRKSVV